MKNKRKNSKRTESEATFGSCLSSSALATLFCCIASLILLAVFAAISLCFEDTLTAARYGACAILYLSAFASGVVSRMLCRSYTLLCGILSGVFFFAVTLVAYYIYPTGDNTTYGILMRLALPLMSLLGAFTASYKRPKRHKRKH